jgi:hypothetical protein
MNNIEQLAKYRGYWPEPPPLGPWPTLPQGWPTEEDLAAGRQAAEALSAIAPPCPVLRVRFTLLRINYAVIPGFGLFHGLADWQQDLCVGSIHQTQPSATMRVDLGDHLEGSSIPFPVDILLNHEECIRALHHHERSLFPAVVRFSVRCGGSVNKEVSSLADVLPGASITHGDDGNWRMGVNVLYAFNSRYGYEVHYTVECCPTPYVFTLTLSQIARAFAGERHLEVMRLHPLDCLHIAFRVLAQHGFRIQTIEPEAGADKLLKVEGPMKQDKLLLELAEMKHLKLTLSPSE